LLRTLVLCDLVDSTALVERLGDQRAAELFRKHDRLARALNQQYGGKEIDKTDGFLLMFDRPIQAVAFALDYQRALKQLNEIEKTALAARLGIHVGDVLTWDNAPDDIAKGAKQVEVEGLVKPITSRLMQLALPNQILLSGVAHSLAHRAQGELGAQLETVRWRTHGRYRFKGIPDPIPVFEVGDEGHAPLKAPPWSGKAHREVPFWRRPATMGIEIGLLLLLLAIPAWYLLKPEPAIAFANRDWVVVGDLKNLTGEASFDESIDTAFRIGLEQSRYVNVLSDLKTRETVRLMQQDPDKVKVDRAIGSEIAIRDGARALILPTVAEIGGRVRVTAEVIDPNTQTTVYSESADGVGAASVLPSLDQVNQKLRVRLGEALATVSNESKPLEKVTTNNLDALRAYSLAWHAYDSGHRKEAISMFDQALKLDPSFALARIGLARAYMTTDQQAKAKEQVAKAMELRIRLSSRDALYVDAWQASFGPQLPALEKWKALSALYPDFFPASGTYGFFSWQWSNRFDEAIEATKKSASPKNPSRAVSDYLLGFLYLGNERFAEALGSFASASAPGAMSRNEYYASAYAAQRQYAKAKEKLAAGHAAGVLSEDVNSRITEISFLADQGQWDAAIDLAENATREASQVGAYKERLFRGIELSLKTLSESKAALSALRDDLQSETSALKGADDVDRADTTSRALLVGYLAGRLGDDKIVQTTLSANLPEARDGRYPVPKQMLAVVEAEQARANGRADQAIASLKPLLNGSELYIVHVTLMDAYAASDRKSEALNEARWLASHRGRAYAEHNAERVLTPYNVAQSNLALLRAAELASDLGQADEARNQLAAFKRAWRDADQIPFIALRLKVLNAALAQRTPATTIAE
jgi:putative peptide modification system cyclase